MNPFRRVIRWGLVAAAVVAIGGWALQRMRIGATDADAVRRIETELRGRVARSTDTLGQLAARVAAQRETIRAVPRDTAAARRLFDTLDAALSDEESVRTGISVYDATGAPLAWTGRVSELPRDVVEGPAVLFVAPGTFGPRLVRIEPLVDRTQPAAPRAATIAVEQSLGSLGPAASAPGPMDRFTVPTSVAPVTLRTRAGGAGASQSPYTFDITSPGGGLLVEAEVSPSDLHETRQTWIRARWAAIAVVLGLTMLLSLAPLVDARRRSRDRRTVVLSTAGLAAALILVRALLWFALGPVFPSHAVTAPYDLLLTTLLLVALVYLAIDLVERRRVARPRPRVLPISGDAAVRVAAAYALAGAGDAVLIWIYERALRAVASRTTLDLLHFSLHPLSGSRLALAFGLVLLHATAIWAAAGLVRLPTLAWRTPRRLAVAAALPAWMTGVLVTAAVIRWRLTPVPFAPLLVAAGAAGACAVALARLRSTTRRASQAARFFALFAALLAPAIAMYPSLLAFGIAAKERLVATDFGPQAANQREDLQDRLRRALDQIDARGDLPALIAGSNESEGDTPSTDRAFIVWQNTDLATYRLTSAVELYGPGGGLVSRYGNLPDYTTTRQNATSCRWDLVEEPSPFGSGLRHVLHADRGICQAGRMLGTIVVRVMLDYQALPFLASQNPYLDTLRPGLDVPAEGVSGRDVEFVVYGWSRAPLQASGPGVWAIPDAVFERLVASRVPFWASLERDGRQFRVFFMNDRGSIYALGYPVITSFGHLMNLAELMTLAGALYVLLLAAATLFNALTSRTPASGRALLREIRSSFYQKLFLAFVAGAIVPVVILAVATRQYFVNQFQTGNEEAAARTATVAQRLVEDYATLQQRGAGSLEALDDQIMVLVGRAIDEDVNLYDRSRLQATSQRDLFASRVLSARTPGDVYERIVLDRLPTYVGVEAVGDAPGASYLLAAAPVRAAGREGIVTVPMTLGQREIERQIDELDRRVLFGAVLFSLLGAAIGYWMAERIADPVNRLTRATRRIARGDLDARIAATSSDELRRLVEDFNQMGADLKRQRVELERTQRLEAWADMARQVAHDIKNPLTPIQLSAEHAQRVNADRGRPLSPVLDECVSAILTQVKLLRQISSEFSSFASSPTARPEPSVLIALLEEVVEPYRTGLTGRVSIEVSVPAGLPRVHVDRTLFSRALTNVIENALHAMPGGGSLRITSSHEAGASHVAVAVSDTGIGMDATALGRIFEPYFSTRTAGTGLGLTIAKRNVELNGGAIAVASERGVGTRVTMTLPVASAAD
ncbi:MAG TPA: HAMP domain-containing sensor histidine kinase [Vicinamibacterales bacterium]|nr:HAMP domain-containing sensor histidine kinase [Vicinamibacterales bacterium]